MQSSSQIITTNKPTSSFLQARCPSCRPTNSVKALKGKYHIPPHLLTPSSPGGLPTLSLTTISSWLPWGRVSMPLISPLMPVPHSSFLTQHSKVKFSIPFSTHFASQFTIFSHYLSLLPSFTFSCNTHQPQILPSGTHQIFPDF